MQASKQALPAVISPAEYSDARAVASDLLLAVNTGDLRAAIRAKGRAFRLASDATTGRAVAACHARAWAALVDHGRAVADLLTTDRPTTPAMAHASRVNLHAALESARRETMARRKSAA